MMEIITSISLFCIVVVLLVVIGFLLTKKDESNNYLIEEFKKDVDNLNQKIGSLESEKKELSSELLERYTLIQSMKNELELQEEKSKKVVSQSKSNQVRLGMTAETLAPFLTQFPYNPTDCSFMGNPLDFVVWNLDAGEIIFVEIKSQNAKESKKQKIIKEIIKSGRVFYEKITINEKGVKVKREENI